MKRWIAALLRRAAGQPEPTPIDEPKGAMLDCESVMRQLWDYLDSELTVDRQAAIRSHLELCKRCHPQFEFERAFLDAVAASAPSHSNPAHLKARLLRALEKQGLRRS